MTLRHLKIFVTVCETGSTTAAGEKLHIAQPSISLAISELEDYYGIKLFDRIAKRLYITEAGKKFLQYATHIVGLFEEMEREIKNFDATGIIRIGASITIGNYLLPGYITRFKKIHPQMDVKVIIDNSEKIQQYILSNQIDIGLIEGIVYSPYIAEHKFRDDELVMVCGNAHPFANQKQMELIDEIHHLGGEVLISSHTGQNISIEEAMMIAKEHERRGADIIKIVTIADHQRDIPKYIECIQRIISETDKKLLFLTSGKGTLIRYIGPYFGVCMYLCVAYHDVMDTKEQPVLSKIKLIRDNFDWSHA
jgi:molybdenum-dependent DNA-binding transcriptional regulator ModE